MIVVTGAAGFIGRNTIDHLYSSGIERIVAVDTQGGLERFTTTKVDVSIKTLDQISFIKRLEAGEYRGKIELIYHFGAITDTLVRDENIILDYNFNYSKRLLKYCVANHVRLIYASSASVYGNQIRLKEGEVGTRALNVYAHYKSQFDLCVIKVLSEDKYAQVVGLRYFNVYGSGEVHKGRMASMVHQLFQQYIASGSVSLFGASHGCVAGEQRRDFVYIDDVIAVNEYFLSNQEISGIYNIGTGSSRSFNEVAAEVVNYCRSQLGQSDRSIDQLVADGGIHYRPFPRELERHYQYHTEANIESLRESGFCHEFCQLDEGVKRFGQILQGSEKLTRASNNPIDPMVAAQA
ncbi:MAG TPA: ADP-glyceromanno-heptose 6-epimerase [Acidiferrobacteraceae bacterium]|nr:ADP-glyceromanno-heptose 6-epimerase [Acidiferrobacteraceae bacterium]